MTAYSASLPARQSKLSAASLAPHAHWLLRIGFASVFLFHGIGKFAAPVQFAEMMQLPLVVVLLVALAEVGGGLAVLAGGAFGKSWMTRLGGLVTVPVMIGAIAMVHWGQCVTSREILGALSHDQVERFREPLLVGFGIAHGRG